MVYLIVILVVLLVAWVYFQRKKKEPRLADVAMITGGVKTGKTTLSLVLCYRRYRKELLRWRIKRFLSFLFFKPFAEKPLLYSNIPLKKPYVPVTEDLILRKVRPAFRSVCYIGEASLVADGFDWKDDETNEQIKLFCKLWGHETHGGCLIFDTQAIKDVHFNIKRSLNTYLWVQQTVKWIPFILVFRVREMYYSEESGVVNTFNEDVDESIKWIVALKKVWKTFDCYCYSHYTDALPVETDVHQAETKTDLKADIVSFKKSSVLKERKGNHNENTEKTLESLFCSSSKRT